MSEEIETCKHALVKCLCCGKEGTPAQLLPHPKGPRSPKAAEQSRQAGKLGGWKKGVSRTDTTILQAAGILAKGTDDEHATYRGVVFSRSAAVASEYAAQRNGASGITVTGATNYIRSVLEAKGMGRPDEAWRHKPRKRKE